MIQTSNNINKSVLSVIINPAFKGEVRKLKCRKSRSPYGELPDKKPLWPLAIWSEHLCVVVFYKDKCARHKVRERIRRCRSVIVELADPVAAIHIKCLSEFGRQQLKGDNEWVRIATPTSELMNAYKKRLIEEAKLCHDHEQKFIQR